MKIGSKIALFYTLLSVLTTIIIIAVFYLFSTQFINKLYASYLREKAYLTVDAAHRLYFSGKTLGERRSRRTELSDYPAQI